MMRQSHDSDQSGSAPLIEELMEEVKKTRDLLQHEKKKRAMRTKAHIDSLAENAKLMKELQIKEAEWEERFKDLEKTMRQKLVEKDEAWMKEVELMKQELQMCQESYQKEKEENAEEKFSNKPESNTAVSQVEKEYEVLLDHALVNMSRRHPGGDQNIKHVKEEEEEKTVVMENWKWKVGTGEKKEGNKSSRGVSKDTTSSAEPCPTKPSASAVNKKRGKKTIVKEKPKNAGENVKIPPNSSAQAMTKKMEKETVLREKNVMVEMEKPNNTMPPGEPTPPKSDAQAGSSSPAADAVQNLRPKEDHPGEKPQSNMEEKPAAPGQEHVNLNLRVGRIISAELHPDADSLFVVTVDVGEASPRTVVSGLLRHLPVEQMLGCTVVLLCNLRPAKVRGVPSQATVMCATSADSVEVLHPPAGAVPGDRVSVGDFPGEPYKELRAKEKERLLPGLHTDSDCVATYRGTAFEVVGKGVCRAQTMSNSRIK